MAEVTHSAASGASRTDPKGERNRGIKFEDALKKLEAVVNGLEGGNLSLEASLEQYEEGVKLVRLCQKKLGEARKRIEVLVKTKDGKIKIEPFEDNGGKKRK